MTLHVDYEMASRNRQKYRCQLATAKAVKMSEVVLDVDTQASFVSLLVVSYARLVKREDRRLR